MSGRAVNGMVGQVLPPSLSRNVLGAVMTSFSSCQAAISAPESLLREPPGAETWSWMSCVFLCTWAAKFSASASVRGPVTAQLRLKKLLLSFKVKQRQEEVRPAQLGEAGWLPRCLVTGGGRCRSCRTVGRAPSVGQPDAAAYLCSGSLAQGSSPSVVVVGQVQDSQVPVVRWVECVFVCDLIPPQPLKKFGEKCHFRFHASEAAV